MQHATRPASRTRSDLACGALAVLAPALLMCAAYADEQTPPASTVGAALHLPDVGCSRPERTALEAFARTAQREVVKYGETQSYPEEALRNQQGGIVYLRLSYAANKEQPRVAVERGSGYAELDRYAITLAEGAGVRPPDPLRCRSFDIAFPLRFTVATLPATLP